MEIDFDIGDLVKSLCGRDSGKVFCVIARNDENYVLLSDGKYRRLAHPKLKKVKHLEKVGVIGENVSAKFKRGAVVFDGELNKAIRMALSDNEN